MSYVPAVDGCATSGRRRELTPACVMYRRFHGCQASEIVAARCRRTVPKVLVLVGALRGLIYGADRGDGPRTYIHFMEEEPWLTCNAEGTQLYIVGGHYRVTRRGIEG